MKIWIIGIAVVIIASIYIILQTKKKTINFSPSNNCMTESEIDRLEQVLNKKLPEYYKNFLMNYPDDLVQLGSPYNTVSELSLPNNADRLIEINEDEEPPSNILVIGVNGLGDFYYLVLDDNPNKIYEFPHDDPPYIDGDSERIDWKKPWGYSDLNALIAELRETLKEEPADEKKVESEQKELNFLKTFVVVTTIECEMRDELLTNRKLETADSYPIPINAVEIASLFQVESSLFMGYPQDYTITYSYLVSVDKNGKVIKPDFLGGDNMRVTDNANKNIVNLQFEPAMKNNQPVDSYVLIRYKFGLDKK